MGVPLTTPQCLVPLAFFGSVLLAGAAGAQPRPAAAAYDAMGRSYRPYLDPADPLAWPAKVRAIDRDAYHFWRGTRDLFYAWCGPHCADWLADRDAFVVSQGDVHLGNTGAYAAAGPMGTLAYGLVDFDESARLPFQIELLQAVVTFDLLARQNRIGLDAAGFERLHAAFFDATAAALADAAAGRPSDGNAGLAAMLPKAKGRTYADELAKYATGGRFRAVIQNKKGDTVDWLRPVDAAERKTLGAALADAVAHDPRLAALLVPQTAGDFDAAVLDVARRTRLDSSGSQGLGKYLVLLRTPFRGQRGDGILYLKQEIWSAAERAGLVPPDPRPPGQRAAEDLDALTHRQSLAASWCAWGGRSFWVSVKEPWSGEPDDKTIKDAGALNAAAAVFARVVADAHAADAGRILPRFTPAVRAAVAARAAAYEAEQAAAYAVFHADPRTAAAVQAFYAAMAASATAEQSSPRSHGVTEKDEGKIERPSSPSS